MLALANKKLDNMRRLLIHVWVKREALTSYLVSVRKTSRGSYRAFLCKEHSGANIVEFMPYAEYKFDLIFISTKTGREVVVDRGTYIGNGAGV